MTRTRQALHKGQYICSERGVFMHESARKIRLIGTRQGSRSLKATPSLRRRHLGDEEARCLRGENISQYDGTRYVVEHDGEGVLMQPSQRQGLTAGGECLGQWHGDDNNAGTRWSSWSAHDIHAIDIPATCRAVLPSSKIGTRYYKGLSSRLAGWQSFRGTKLQRRSRQTGHGHLHPAGTQGI